MSTRKSQYVKYLLNYMNNKKNTAAENTSQTAGKETAGAVAASGTGIGNEQKTAETESSSSGDTSSSSYVPSQTAQKFRDVYKQAYGKDFTGDTSDDTWKPENPNAIKTPDSVQKENDELAFKLKNILGVDSVGAYSKLKSMQADSKAEDSTYNGPVLYGTGTSAWNASPRGAEKPSPFLNNVASNRLNPSIDVNGKGNSGNNSDSGKQNGGNSDTATEKKASEMTSEELLKKLSDEYFTPQSYTGLSDDEKNELIDSLRKQAQQTEEDTMGKYAAMTGGVPSTAAVAQAAKAGSDVMSQLQDIISQQESTKYDRWRNQQTDAYNRLNAFLSMNGSAGTSSNSTSGDTSGTASSTSSDSVSKALAKETGGTSADYTDFLSEYSVDGSTPISEWANSYSNIRKKAESVAQLSPVLDGKTSYTADEYLNKVMPEYIMDDLAEKYPDDFPYRMAAIIDYLYDSGSISEEERNQWLENSNLAAIIQKYLENNK